MSETKILSLTSITLSVDNPKQTKYRVNELISFVTRTSFVVHRYQFSYPIQLKSNPLTIRKQWSQQSRWYIEHPWFPLFWSRRACVRHTWWRTKRSWPTFFLFLDAYSLRSQFFFSASYFSPTSGNLPCVKICFPQYFGITRRYIQKKIFFLGNFFSRDF